MYTTICYLTVFLDAILCENDYENIIFSFVQFNLQELRYKDGIILLNRKTLTIRSRAHTKNRNHYIRRAYNIFYYFTSIGILLLLRNSTDVCTHCSFIVAYRLSNNTS